MSATVKSLPSIRQLPENLVNQIAAGEVIERPASVVKELLENSIDAGAHRIEVSIVGGGSELIRISDDGCGMTAEQLPLAVASHATSKLPDAESLFGVRTLGFRGEALASIGSVSQLTIRSRTESDDAGSEIMLRGGAVQQPVPCGCPVGTVIEVKNLFFNTPVRHRFLKSAQTEKGHIVEAFTRLALAYPAIHFVLTNNDKLVHELPSTTRWADRLGVFFGGEIADALIPIESDDGQIRVSGYVCDPAISRGNNRMQYLFLNGRHIRDRALQHALGEAYRGMLMVGRHPVAFLRMDMPAELIDVNVHPTKLEVRFTDAGRIYSRLLQSLRHQFLRTNLHHRVGPGEELSDDGVSRAAVESELGMPAAVEHQHRQGVIDWARSGDVQAAAVTRNLGPAGVSPFRPFSDGGSSTPTSAASPEPATADLAPWDDATSNDAKSDDAKSDDAISDDAKLPSVCYLGFQVHNRYLVTQDESGMVVIDQHALHERVLYERVCAKVLESGERLESQRLLVPEPVCLTPAEWTAALEAKETLAQIGIELEDFGGQSILIQSYPAILKNVSPGDMLRTILEALISAGKQPDPKDLLNHLLSTIACKAAVKAGNRLSPAEITSLLEQKDLYHDTHHCPHGRPTALFFSREELDRMFGRLGPRGRSASRPTSH